MRHFWQYIKWAVVCGVPSIVVARVFLKFAGLYYDYKRKEGDFRRLLQPDLKQLSNNQFNVNVNVNFNADHKVLRRRLCIGFRGAGNFAYYYLGAAEAIVKQLSRETLEEAQFEGASSGALFATLLACGLDPCDAGHKFEAMLAQHKAQHWPCFCPIYPWGACCFGSDARCRTAILPQFFASMLTDEMVRKASGRLKVVAFDCLSFMPASNNQWRSVQHLTEWVLASMAIPGMTGWPRWIDGKLLMDAFNMDVWLWRKDPNFKRINISVFDNSSTISPSAIQLPLFTALTQLPDVSQQYLKQLGLIDTLSYLSQRSYC